MGKFIAIVVLLLLLPNVLGLGITPAKHSVVLNGEESIEYTLYNTESKNLITKIDVSGDLANIVSIEPEDIVLKSGEPSKTFTVTLTPNGPFAESSLELIVSATDGNSVSAVLEVSAGESLPTGNVVSDDVQTGTISPPSSLKAFLIPGLLILLIAGNIGWLMYSHRMANQRPNHSQVLQENLESQELTDLKSKIRNEMEAVGEVPKNDHALYTADGVQIMNLPQMIYYLEHIKDDTFAQYQIHARVHSWVGNYLNEQELAGVLSGKTSRNEMIAEIKGFMQHVQKQDKKEVNRLMQEIKDIEERLQ